MPPFKNTNSNLDNSFNNFDIVFILERQHRNPRIYLYLSEFVKTCPLGFHLRGLAVLVGTGGYPMDCLFTR